MSNAHGTFATAINCMDGRVQIPVISWIKKHYGVDYVDMITEAGPNKILSEKSNPVLRESIKKRIEISVNKHGSKLIVIAGHHDCAGNPVEEDIQKSQIKAAILEVGFWGFENVEVVGVYVNEKWEMEKVA